MFRLGPQETHITIASSGKPLRPIWTSLVMQAAVPSPTREPYQLDIPRAYSVNDQIPLYGTPAPTQGGDELELSGSSAGEDERNAEINDNPVRAPTHAQSPVANTQAVEMAVQGGQTAPSEPRASTTEVHRHRSLSKRPLKPPGTAAPQEPADRNSGAEHGSLKRSSSSLFGSFAGLFSHRSTPSATSEPRGDPPSPTKTRSRMAQRDASPPRQRPQASRSGAKRGLIGSSGKADRR